MMARGRSRLGTGGEVDPDELGRAAADVHDEELLGPGVTSGAQEMTARRAPPRLDDLQREARSRADLLEELRAVAGPAGRPRSRRGRIRFTSWRWSFCLQMRMRPDRSASWPSG
jgi:hypothetical protein